jgi:hypothetical protein
MQRIGDAIPCGPGPRREFRRRRFEDAADGGDAIMRPGRADRTRIEFGGVNVRNPIQDMVVGHLGRGIDGFEMGLERGVEIVPLARRNPDHLRQGVQGFSLAGGDVHRQIVHVLADESFDRLVADERRRPVAAQGAAADAEGLVAEDAVGGDRQNLEDQAVLAFEHHRADAASAVFLGNGRRGRGRQNPNRNQHRCENPHFSHRCPPCSGFRVKLRRTSSLPTTPTSRPPSTTGRVW